MDIKGHAAIVTGGGSGLGAATAAELAQRRRQGRAARRQHAMRRTRIAKTIGGIAIKCDVSDSASAEAAIRQGERADMAPARILVNCAGIGPAEAHRRPRRADAARRLRAGHQGQPDRHVQHDAPVRRGRLPRLEPMEDGERGVIDQHRLGRRLRRADRAGRLCVVEGRHRRPDAAGRARARAVRHPRLRHRARHFLHADAAWACPRRSAEEPRRLGAVPAACWASRSNTPRSRATSSRTAISTAR